MLKRLLVGLVLGVLIGGIVAAGIVKGMGVASFADTGGAALAYLAATVTGVLAGLVAGKPIWAKGAWIEVGLKAFFGSLLAAGAMFALRKWVDVSVDLAGLGAGKLGDLPVTALPIISTVLGVFYELDNTGSEEEAADGKASTPNKRVALGKGKARVAEEVGESDEDEQESKKRMKK
jgi:hypothetical protein